MKCRRRVKSPEKGNEPGNDGRMNQSTITIKQLKMKKNQTKISAEPGKQEIFIVREFEAPRELVFKAFTDPKLLVRWLGPRELTMKIDQFEPRSGGSYRYIHS